MAGVIAGLVFVVALVLSMPIAMSLGLAGLAAIMYLSPDLLVVVPQSFLASMDSFPLLAVPLFILSGVIMAEGGVARRIIRLAMALVGRVPGGLGMVTVVATMFFSGISGSTSADTAAIGSLTLPEMKKRGYPPAFAAAVVASAGATASLIPPSIDFILIGVIANISIGGLFAAGVLPGIVNGVGLLALVYYYGRKLNLPLEPRMSFRETLSAFAGGIPALIMAAIILGGVLGGVFTATEASAVAAVYGFILCFFFYRELKVADLPRLLLRTAELSGMVLLVVGMASVVSFVLTYDRVPHLAAQFVVQHSGGWIGFVFLVNVLFLIIGCISDTLPAIIVLMPILVPIAVSLGMDPIHLGVLIEANVGVGFITPPVGISLYIACGIAGLPIGAVVRPLVPFILVLTTTLLIISYVPAVSLFIPRLLGYTQ